MPKFRKKPVDIDAIRYTGDNEQEIAEFMEGKGYYTIASAIYIETFEGDMACPPGWWVIKGVEGEFYPCKPSVFEATYESVD